MLLEVVILLSNAEIGARMETRRLSLGMTMEDVATKIGVAKSTIQRYEKGQIGKIKLPVIESIASVLGVNPDWLIGNTENMTIVQRAIPTAKNIIPMPKMKKIPLLGTIACGEPILATENIEDEIDIPEHIHADFALRCKGDSMVGAEIYDGDIVYIKQQAEVLDGQIAAVLIEDEATLKRFYYNRTAGVVTLVSENPAIPPMIYQGETLNHIKVLGKAVGLTRQI